MKRHLPVFELVELVAFILLGVFGLWLMMGGSPWVAEYWGFSEGFPVNFYFALLFFGLWFAQIGIVVIIRSAWKKRRKKIESQATVRSYIKTSHEARIKATAVIVLGVPALLIVLGFLAYAGAYTLEMVSKDFGMETFGFFLILIGIFVYLAELAAAAVLGVSESHAVVMTCPSCGVKMIQTVNGFPDGSIYNSPCGTSTRVAAWVCPNCGKILPIV